MLARSFFEGLFFFSESASIGRPHSPREHMKQASVSVVFVGLTFGLGGHGQCGGALPSAVAVVGNHPEAVLSVRHQVLDGHLHLTRPAGVQHTLPGVIKSTQRIVLWCIHISILYIYIE